MEPENEMLEKEVPFETYHFLVPKNFWGGNGSLQTTWRTNKGHVSLL